MSSLKIIPEKKVITLCLAFFLGALGLHRFYLRSWWGIIYLPLLYSGLTLMASQYLEAKSFGKCLLVFLFLLCVADFYRILKDNLKMQAAKVGPVGFFVIGLILAHLLWGVIGFVIIVSKIVYVGK